jgi:hypothetical protein
MKELPNPIRLKLLGPYYIYLGLKFSLHGVEEEHSTVAWTEGRYLGWDWRLWPSVREPEVGFKLDIEDSRG